MNYLAVLGKKYQSAGIEDLSIESGMYDSSTISILLKGKSYNRGIKAHTIVMGAMFRLQWRAFVQWLSQKGDGHLDENLVIEQVITCLKTLEEGKYVSTVMHWLLHLSVTAVMTPRFFSMDRPNYSVWPHSAKPLSV